MWGFRYFAAKKEYDALVEAIAHGSQEGQEGAFADARAALDSAETRLMLERSQHCENALKEYNMETTEDERWVLGLDMFGYRTHYIIEEDNNVLVRIEGSQDSLPLFEQLSVIRELQLYKEWVPFCNKSEMLHEISNTDMIAFMHIWTPLGLREIRHYLPCLLSFACLHGRHFSRYGGGGIRSRLSKRAREDHYYCKIDR